MHLAIQFFVFWGLAFGTLLASLGLLNIYYGLIERDLILRSVGQEAIIAGIVSLIEGASVWAIVSFLPAAIRALFVPALVVAIVYKLSHLEDWSRYEIVLLLLFQITIGCSGAFLVFGHFQSALIILVVFGGLLAVATLFAKGL